MTGIQAKLRILRVYHGGRDPQHRARERALAETAIDVTLVVPSVWPDPGTEEALSSEAFPVIELPVKRPGDVNRHSYLDRQAIRRVLEDVRPDVLDIHAEPFSLAARQWLQAAAPDLPVVMYTAQNVDKRYPPPFAQYERNAYRRVAAFYPCSRQAAAVLRGKGYSGTVEIIDLGYDDTLFRSGSQTLETDELVLAFVGRLVPEKGVMDAVRVLAGLNKVRPARLLLRGSGPEEKRARGLADSLGVSDRVEFGGWQEASDLAGTYRRTHVVLVPSYPTASWAEQFGRVIVEAQACGAVVAGYATGTIAEVVGYAGVIVSTGDVEQLVAGVARLVSTPHEFAWRRKAGQQQSAARTWRAVAARQAGLYGDARRGASSPPLLGISPRRRRAAARREFGPTAATLGHERPFAVPLLRRGGVVAGILAAACDLGAEIIARLYR